MGSKAPPNADDILVVVETPEKWGTICGDAAQKDMLFVVEVYAAWCGPSQAAISTYKKIKDANEAKKFKLCKVCADVVGGEGEYLEQFKILARPTFLFFKDGEQVAQVDGISMPQLEKCVPHIRVCLPFSSPNRIRLLLNPAVLLLLGGNGQ